MKKICVLGLGYIGLPTAAFLAHAGYDVRGVDIDGRVNDMVNKGKSPFPEPGFSEFLEKVVKSGKLAAYEDVANSDVFIIAVPTPFEEDHRVDLSYIHAAARKIAPHLKKGNLVILESTTAPGTTEELRQLFVSLRPELFAGVDGEDLVMFAHAPERVIPGKIMEEMVNNDRIIGGYTELAAEKAAKVYEGFCKGEILQTNSKTAELTKLVENSFRDVNIAFANEISLICYDLGIDPWEVRELANRHPRVNILAPGPGVGGHCIAVDPWFIVSAAPSHSRLVQTAREINDSIPNYYVAKVQEAIDENQAKEIAVLGLTFKADVDDLRGSPSLHIAKLVATSNRAVKVNVVEPNLDCLPDELVSIGNVKMAAAIEAIESSEIVVCLVEHREFWEIPKELLKGKIVVDAKGILETEN